MNVDRRWWESSVVRGRVLTAGLLLLGAACAVLALAGHSRQIAAKASSSPASGPKTLPSVVAGQLNGQSKAALQEKARSILTGLPLVFEPNQGQGSLDASDARARFVARGAGYSLFLGDRGATLSLVSQSKARRAEIGKPSRTIRVQSIEMNLAGANPDVRLAAADPLPGKSNYFLGNDPAKWRTSVPQFGRVRYEGVYPGIDLVFYGNQGKLEYDFQVAPGADPSRTELEFHGANGLKVQDGALIIQGRDKDVRLEAPSVYQEIEGRRQPVQGKFVVRGANRAGFAVGTYDRSRELVIDPILNFSTYFGGSGDEHATSVAIDGAFNIYLAGSTTSPNLPVTTGVYQTTLAGTQNVYVAKIVPPLGSIAAALTYVTYLGGNGTDSPIGVEVDGGGNAYVAGTTTSTNFPTSLTRYQAGPEAGSVGASHVFVTRLNTTATGLTYSSYLSGNNTDIASGMALDPSQNVYVTGTTASTDTAVAGQVLFPASTLPEMEAFQAISVAPIQFFVTKINTNASLFASVAYSTYFGGQNGATNPPVAVGGGIAVDTNQNVYFTGKTNFTYTGTGVGDFPILNAYQPCLNQAPPTVSTNPPTCAASTATASDAFVAKLKLAANTAPGQQLQWSTYLGGSQTDAGTGVALDPGAASVYVIGTTNSQDFIPTTTQATMASYQKCLNNLPVTPASGTVTCTAQTDPAPNDAFLAKVTNPTNATGTPTNMSLSYFTYLGGANDEAGTAITVDSAAGALITGWTQSPNTGTDGTFPVAPSPNSIQGTLNGTQDAFIARLNTAAVLGQTTQASWSNYFGGTGIDSGTGIALDVNQDTYLAGDTNSADLRISKAIPTVGTQNNGGYDSFVTQFGTALSLSIQGVLTLGSNQTFVTAGNPATFTYTITNNGPDLATGIVVTDNLATSVTGVPVTLKSASTTSGTCPSSSGTSGSIVSCSLNALQPGSTATVTIVLVPSGNPSGTQAIFNGGTVQVMAQGNIVLAQTQVPATMSDFTMSVSPNNFSVPQAGATATYSVQLTPSPIYASQISLSCSGNPTGTSCNFTPTNSITLQSTSGSTVTMSIPTTARPVITPATMVFPRMIFAFGLVIPGLLFTAGGNRRRKRLAGILTLCALSALMIFVPACSHTNSQVPPAGTPPGNYTITVTASSGSNSKSQVVTLYVP